MCFKQEVKKSCCSKILLFCIIIKTTTKLDAKKISGFFRKYGSDSTIDSIDASTIGFINVFSDNSTCCRSFSRDNCGV